MPSQMIVPVQYQGARFLGGCALALLMACGGGGGGSEPAPPPAVTVAVTPSTATVTVGATRAFTAQVANASTPSVTWTASGGSITTGGLFTAPAAPGAVTVTATSVADSSKTGTAAVTVVAAPVQPVVTATAQATEGTTGLTASVPASSGMTYAWTLVGGTITSPGGAAGQTSGGVNAITWTAGSAGTATLTCVETNAALDASPAGQATVTLNPAPLTPVVTAPAFATTGDSLVASVPARAGMAYLWSITGGTITSPGGTAGEFSGGVNRITWTAGAVGTATLSCVEINATPTSSLAGTATTGIDPVPHALPQIEGFPAVKQGTTGWKATVASFAGATYAWTLSGPGILDGGETTAQATWHPTGLGTITLGCTVTNRAGASDTQSGTVTSVTGGAVYTAAPPSPGRMRHTATLLLDGRVLIVGGQDTSVPGQITGLASAELYDPSTGLFSATSGAPSTGRYYHSATLLADGRVLVAGGVTQETLGPSGVQQFTDSAELFDPATGTFSAAGTMVHTRSMHSANLLPDGRVLIVGGTGDRYERTAETFDPGTGLFSATALSMSEPRESHRAVSLWDGRVLLVGGKNRAAGTMVTTAELYDPTSGAFTSTGALALGRARHAASLLMDGRVLATGGRDLADDYLSDAMIYDPNGGAWAAGPAMGYAHSSHASLLLPNGQTFITGTFGMEGRQELFSPDGTSVSYTVNSRDVRSGGTATLLTDGRVLLVGGTIGEGGNINASAELWSAGDTTLGIETMPGGQAVVSAGKSLPVFAVVSGNANGSVSWTLTEGAAGGTLSATTGNGITYTAPAAPGTYHLVATCQADGATSATLTLVVQ